jgi:hypothetical protein
LCGKYKQSALLEHRHLSAETESSICCKIYPFAFLRLLQRERFVNNSFFSDGIGEFLFVAEVDQF